MVFQHGTALHLALLTVAPLFLQAFFGTAASAMCLMWLSAFAALWIVMNPSPRSGEWPRDARCRIGWELVRDPLLMFFAVALIFSAIRAINGGVELAYDAQSGVWHLTDSFIPLLPGCVSGCGLLPLAGLLSLAIVFLGVRHALGARARFSYLFLSALLSALAVALLWVLRSRGATVPHLTFESTDPFCLGSLLGVFFLFALVAWVESCVKGWTVPEVASSLAAAVLLAGLLAGAPAVAVWAFGSLGLVTVGCGVFFAIQARMRAGWFLMAFTLLIALAPAVLLAIGEISRPALWPIVPKGFLALREAATSVALEAWRGSTRLGVGLGAYPLVLGFHATPENWQVLSALQTAAPNGWVHFLFERGIIGCVFFLAGLGLILKDLIVRYVRAGLSWTLTAQHLLGALVLLPAVAVLFFECTFVQMQALIPVAASLALSAAALPEFAEENHG